ncbi:hypothetical protein [Isoptericola variabilis]|uniref:Secreted protein n=1 Tax=Isoptericola variabilis (strain 225) TaxID=743718 RepID=F6FX31_ISOV2|nr:hypothetical protein [Isoptericola variabilis]AEG44631.1 hypothetical protein Isova_1888 [Isoptericola variabilis 225]TWH28319.1 hypothetical protein L600_004100000090 [Isoptericola variabilis J7]
MNVSRRTVRTVLAAVTAVLALLFLAGQASASNHISPQNAPSGTHLQTGSIGCSTGGNSVSCTGFELAGVGNTDATVVLEARYTANIQCTNKGGKLVESHTHTAVDRTEVTVTSAKNGRLAIPAQMSTAPSESQILAQADCPNPNWTPNVQPGSVMLAGFTYSVTFAGFTAPYILITG